MNKADSPTLEAFLEQQSSVGVPIRRLSAPYTPIRVGTISITEDRDHPDRFTISGRGSENDADEFVRYLIESDERLRLPDDKGQVWNRYQYCKHATTVASGHGWSCAGWMISWQQFDDSWFFTMSKQSLMNAAA